MPARKYYPAIGLFAAALCLPMLADAHAFPRRSSPRVGATLEKSPGKVTIWFDANLTPVFSKITVKNTKGRVVSTGDSQVPANHPAELVTGLKPLKPGQYWVIWSVVASDGHHTQGRFPFYLK